MEVAFAGGIDLTVQRWDTQGHAAIDPIRLTPEGSAYGPVRDLQMMVEGSAAQAIVEPGHAGGTRLRQRQLGGFLAAPAGTMQVAGELCSAPRTAEFAGAASGRVRGGFGHLLIRPLMSLSDL